MNEEEKKAIERIEDTFYSDLGKGINKFQKITLYEDSIKDVRIVLNLLEKLQKENEELREKWDKDTHILQNELDLTNADKINNYIPIQKVKDNLIKYQEEYELLLEHQSGKESNRTKYLRGRIHMCQELLEGRK